MAAEQVLSLLDFFWFETTILTNKSPNQIPHTKVEEQVLPLHSKLLSVPTPSLEIRSYSDQNLDSTTCILCDFLSPNSVLTPPKLRTIPSEREIREFSMRTSNQNHEKEDTNIKERRSRKRRLKKGRTSRSLSELEFEELKGFMDLGFVFSEEDKDSKLVSLIPGLQRLGKEDAEQGDENQSMISDDKPYLSQAWDVLDQRKMKNPLINWKISAKDDEIHMKDNLKFWAHTVASIVR